MREGRAVYHGDRVDDCTGALDRTVEALARLRPRMGSWRFVSDLATLARLRREAARRAAHKSIDEGSSTNALNSATVTGQRPM